MANSIEQQLGTTEIRSVRDPASGAPEGEPVALPKRAAFGDARVSMALMILGLFLAATLAAASVSTSVFERLPHSEDELAFLFQARTLASGRLVAPAPPLPQFFEAPFIIIREGMWFGKYLPGFPAVLALGVLGGQPWLVNPVLAGLAAVLVFLAGRRLYGPWTGLLAALLMIASPLFLIQAGSFLSHVVGLAWAVVVLLLFESTRRTGSGLAALGLGVALGALFLTRPLTAVGIAIPYGVWIAIDLLGRRGRWRTFLPAALGLLPFVVAFLAYNGYTTGSPFRTGYELWWPYDRVGFGDGIGTAGKHTLEAGMFHTRLSIDDLSDYLFGWPWGLSLVPAAIASAAGIGKLLWKGSPPAGLEPDGSLIDSGGSRSTDPGAKWDLLQVGVVVSLIVVHITYWVPGTLYGPRYYFEALGALALLSARGIVGVAGMGAWVLRVGLPSLPRPGAWASVATMILVIGLFAHSFTSFTPQMLGRHVRWYDIDGAGLRVVGEARVRDAVVFVERGYWTDYAPFFSENAPTLDSDIVYAIDRGEANGSLMALYPGRSFYRYSGGQLTPLPASQ